MLERLADEHEREVTVLKTEVTELRTQLGVLDPTSKYMNRTTNKSLNFGDVMERWKEGHKCTPKKTAANLTVQELPSMHVPQVMQVWAEKKRLAQTQRGEQAPTDDATGPAERPKVPTNSNTPEDDWPPPVPVPANTTPAEKFWISFDDQSKRSAGEEEEDEDDEGRAEAAEELMRKSLQSLVSAPKLAGTLMESQHAFRDAGMLIKRQFEDASRMSNPNGVLESCFRVWGLLTRHMREHFSFPLLEAWGGNGPASNAAGGLVLGQGVDMKHEGAEDDFHHAEDDACDATSRTRNGFGRLLLAPNATVRSWWDLAGTLLLIYDIIGIPMDAFEPEPNTFTQFMDYFTLVFWSADIFMSCITGYVARGVTIMDPKLIIKNYLRTLFLMDLVVVGPDWIFLIVTLASQGSNNAIDAGQGSNRIIRVMRVVRLARLLRLVKLTRGLAMVRDRIESEFMFIVVNIFKLILMLLFVNHVLGSLWYLVGTICRSEGEVNWIVAHEFADSSLGYRYFTSLHWSLTQFTPASMSVQPQNIYERMFAICVLVFGLVLFSSFISSITASMTQLRNMSEDKSKQFWLLRKYLRQRGIDKQLTFRILRYVEYAIKEKTVLVSDSKVWSLGLLSQQLREELQYEVSFKCLMSHPFFEKARTVSSMSTFQLAAQALSVEMLASRDTIFNPGTLATAMFIVAFGQLKYQKMDELNIEETDDTNKLTKDDWACEHALWTKWTHMGCLRAVSEVRLVAIDVKKFQDVVNKDPIAWNLAHTYAEKYVDWLNATSRGDLTDVAHHIQMCFQVRHFLAPSRTGRAKMTVKALGLLDSDDATRSVTSW